MGLGSRSGWLRVMGAGLAFGIVQLHAHTNSYQACPHASLPVLPMLDTSAPSDTATLSRLRYRASKVSGVIKGSFAERPMGRPGGAFCAVLAMKER